MHNFDQLCQSSAVKKALEEVNLKLETVPFGSAKKALHLPLKYVAAWWCEPLRLASWGLTQSFGISANLARTKTSGPAKKVEILKVFVSIRAFLTHAQWLATGWSLCEEMADEVGAHRKFGQLHAKDCTLCSGFGNVASSNRALADEARWQLVSAAVAWCVSLLERALGTHHFANLGPNRRCARGYLQDTG